MLEAAILEIKRGKVSDKVMGKVRGQVNLKKRSIFLVLGACLGIACTSSAPPPVPVEMPPVAATPATRAAQPQAAAGHDHASHELEEKMPRVSAQELKRLVAAGRAVAVDVRSAEEYRRAHIEGAINLPIQQIETGQYPKLPRDKRLVSYCT